MSTSLPSDEVAEDYKNALDDLVTNDRYQIANLTMIAKENIEHAEAISRVLANHIKRAPPNRKLPALYVLDSLVKNIGSPYTVYFGRNLHETFMFAYSQVDGTVRRKLEEMLKTWREPVPGSLSATPVFPFPSTQTIVDSLNKFRTSTTSRPHYHHQPSGGIRPPHLMPQIVPFRNTPTPPQASAPYQPPAAQLQTSTPVQQNVPQIQYSLLSQLQASGFQPDPFLPSHTPTPQPYVSNTPTYSLPQHQARPPSRSNVDLRTLGNDVDDLTTDAKIECATHPMDATARQKLQTLQALKEIIDSGNASEPDLIEIRDSVAHQMSKRKLEKAQALPQVQEPVNQQYSGTPQLQSSYMAQPQYQLQQQQYSPPTPVPSFLNSTNLAELLRATSNNASSQSQPAFPSHAYPSSTQAVPTTPAPNAIPMPQGVELPLLAQLRASGLLSALSTPLSGVTPPALTATLPLTQSAQVVKLTSASLKISRPDLIVNFLSSKPNQCTTCGRRFTSDEVGKEKKARHLDWHFRTKARLNEAERRGQNRSWYVDEREWISSMEYEDDAGLVEPSGTSNGAATTGGTKKKQDFVLVPSDAALRNSHCPIDQEPFRSEWDAELQEFIWEDAIKVGDRYYHASCYREVTKQRDRDTGGNPPTGAGHRTATPDSLLGKRKAENDDPSSASKSRVKVE